MRIRIGLLVALTAMLSAVASVAGAAGMETDPASVSEGLKAIFKYGNTTRQTAERLNANTVTIMTGTVAGTYVQQQFAHPLARAAARQVHEEARRDRSAVPACREPGHPENVV